jgi:hypothetical protein
LPPCRLGEEVALALVLNNADEIGVNHSSALS